MTNVPNSSNFGKVAQMLNSLVPQLSKAIEPVKEIKEFLKDEAEFAKHLTKVGDRGKFFESESNFNQGSKKRAYRSIIKVVGDTYAAQVKELKGINKILTAIKNIKIREALPKSKGGYYNLGALGALAAGAGVIVFGAKTAEYVQEIQDEKENKIQGDLQRQMNLIVKHYAEVKIVNQRVTAVNKDVDKINKIYFEQKPKLDKAAKDANDALYEVRAGRQKLDLKIQENYKLANDALYEIRVGKQKLEIQIQESRKLGNDALYEVRTGKQKFEAQSLENRKLANDALYEVRQGRQKLEIEIKSQEIKNQTTFQKIQTQLETSTKTITSNFQIQLDKTVTKFNTDLASAQASAKKNEIAIGELNKKAEKIDANVELTHKTVKSVNSTIEEIPKKQKVVVTEILGPVLKEYRTASLQDTRAEIDKSILQLKNPAEEFAAKTDKIYEEMKKEFQKEERARNDSKYAQQLFEERLEAVEQQSIKNGFGYMRELFAKYDKQYKDLENLFKEEERARNDSKYAQQLFEKRVGDSLERFNQRINNPTIISNNPTITDLQNRTGQLKNELTNLKPQLEQLKSTQIKNEEMNIQGLQKLDLMLPVLTAIPPAIAKIPTDTVEKIKPEIPPLVSQGVCKTTQPGGCMNKALDDNTNKITANNDKKWNDFLNAANFGGQLADLALLKVIDKKLGKEMPGGITGAFGRLWDIFKIDRVLNTLTYVTVLHNALMLSNNIGQTLFGALDNIADFAGFKWTNEQGKEVSFSELVNQFKENFLKSLFGADNYTKLTESWQKANRIYQSVTNMLSDVQSMFDSARNIAELTAGATGKIGNALKRAGVVYENSYNWMQEKVTSASSRQSKMDAIINGLQGAENAASSLSTITSEVVSIRDNLTSLQESRETFQKELTSEKTKEENKSKDEKTNAEIKVEISSDDTRKGESKID